ncbi:MAG: UDP-3-O-(3-hydroxymyristoyl)glucosamine N-acyltransferase [Proteobacteria bacterium]|nr:UDP-3-O-(3-hydroxymyristoyl)glucosamine N-acyltransferase [Pseudomonadota bacterium]
MADSRFFKNAGPFTLAEVARACGGKLHDEAKASMRIKDLSPLSTADTGDLSFLDNKKYVEAFQKTKAGACIIHSQYIPKAPTSMALIVSDNPYASYARAATLFYPHYSPIESRISERATIHPSAQIGEQAEIEAGAVIGANAVIGEKCLIRANSVIGDGVIIGKNTTIHAGVHLTHSVVGEHVIIHQGASIGQDGFGFAFDKGQHLKVPQLGRVVIGNHVEIGANSTIDRGSGPDTVIGDGTKIDNLVQIGHNVTLGKGCIIVAHVGISGSTTIGDYTVIGGQVGVAGHLTIGSQVKIAAQSGVMRDVEDGITVGGTPAVPIIQYHRQTTLIEKMVKKNKAD